MSADEPQDPARSILGALAESVAHGAYFCANPECALHVRAGDTGVEGEGDWIVLDDGRTYGRSRHGDRMLCDACGTGRGPVKMPFDRAERDRSLAERSNLNE